MDYPSSTFSHGWYKFGYYDYNEIDGFIINVVTFIIVCIGLPLTLLAIFALCASVQKDHVAPIYVINLLISDLIQFCCMIIWVAQPKDQNIYGYVYYVYFFGVVTSVCFMVCIALERYLVIAHPLWYHARRDIETSVVVSVVIWAVTLFYLFTYPYWVKMGAANIISGIFFLLPLPLFIFCLVGTLRALSASISVPSEEKRRVVGILVLVLLIYTLLFLPSIISPLAHNVTYYETLNKLALLCLRLSPLVYLFLYVFMRIEAKAKQQFSSMKCDNMSTVSIKKTERWNGMGNIVYLC